MPQTGTSRISTLKMYPMSLYESDESSGEISLIDLFDKKLDFFVESKLTIDQLIFAICIGGWPRTIFNKSKEAQLEIANDLFYQICSSDISSIDHTIRNPGTARKILRSYSNRCLIVFNYISKLNFALILPKFRSYRCFLLTITKNSAYASAYFIYETVLWNLGCGSN